MAPKRQSFKRKASSSAAQESHEFDADLFLSYEHYQRYLAIQSRTLHCEKKVALAPGEYPEITREIQKRKWKVLADPIVPNVEMVKEFYANAYSSRVGVSTYSTFVRGVEITFDPESLNTALGTTLQSRDPSGYTAWKRIEPVDYQQILAEIGVPGATYTMSDGVPKLILRSHLKPVAKIWTTFIHANLSPCTHNSDITEPRSHLLFCIMTGRSISVGHIIAHELSQAIKSNTSGPLLFPALITLLCKQKGLDVTRGALQKLRGPIDHKYIRQYCQIETPGASSSRPSRTSAPAAAARSSYLRTDVFEEAMRQRAQREEALYRSDTFIMDSLRQLSLSIPGASFPSSQEYSDYVAWPVYPGDQGNVQRGDDMAVEGADAEDDAASGDDNGDEEEDDAGDDDDDAGDDGGDGYEEDFGW